MRVSTAVGSFSRARFSDGATGVGSILKIGAMSIKNDVTIHNNVCVIQSPHFALMWNPVVLMTAISTPRSSVIVIS